MTSYNDKMSKIKRQESTGIVLVTFIVKPKIHKNAA